MAWTTPIEWADQQLVTAALLNEQLSNNLKFLYPPSSVRVYNNASISVPTATATALTFNTERFDTESIHDPASQSSHLTCKTAGKYLIWGNVAFQASNIGYRQLKILLNGSIAVACTQLQSVGDTNYSTVVQVSTICDLAVDDYVELFAYHTSSGALPVLCSNQFSPEFGMQRIG